MYEYKCKIVRVVDGDTVDVDIDLGFGVWMHKERVRLYGIDTPESRTRDLEEKKFGLFAKRYVEEYLPVGTIQTLKTHKDGVGKYGRILGEFLVYDGDSDAQKSLSDMIVNNNIGVSYMGQSKNEIVRQHLQNREMLYEGGFVERSE